MGKKYLFFLAIVIIAIGFGAYATFSYWNISDGNKWSTFFSYISSLSLFVTACIYLFQKADEAQKVKLLKEALIKDFSQVIDSIDMILDINKEDDDKILLTNTEKGVTVHRYDSGVGFSLNKIDTIDYLDVYKSKLIKYDIKASIAISKLKTYLNEYNLSIDKLIDEVDKKGYTHKKSILMTTFNEVNNLEIIKYLISRIK
ncbi:hypothetical protein AB7250_18800 [Providencia stuartii]|uniref:hypothetical protein n=1 Tax=Providencia stuartii TaxID=588 RepID=UPI001B78D9C1|nr:hypothetical protein [Providencia stuartii]MBQ0457537.1 hypothetical protein [Providencia stuartii]